MVLNRVLAGLNPAGPLAILSDVFQIRRESHNEGKMVDYTKRWADNSGLRCTVDKVLNVNVHLPAFPGYEHVPHVTAQIHSDMVVLPGDDLDAPIEIEVVNGWLQTKGRYRTLGTDNGAGYSIVLDAAATLRKRGAMNVLVTADEEDDFTGAHTFDADFHGIKRGGLLVNIDTPYDRKINVSHAGFRYVESSMKLVRARMEGKRITLTLSDMPGGHSGEDVHRACGSAIRSMAFIISRMPPGTRIVSINGGDKKNNIPKDCTAVVQVPPGSSGFQEVDEYVDDLKVALRCPGLKFVVTNADSNGEALTEGCHQKVMNLLLGLPTGVIRMSKEYYDLPTLSSTPSLVWEEDGVLKMKQLIRGACDDAMDALAAESSKIYRANGFEPTAGPSAKAWNQTADHPLVLATLRAYKDIGYPALLGGNHGALELGNLVGDPANPVFSAGVSFGPQIVDEHKKSERMNLASFARANNAFRTLMEGIADGWLVA